MNYAYIPFIVIGLAAGIGIYCYFFGVPVSFEALMQANHTFWAKLQEALAPLISAWNTIPETIRALIIPGILGAVSLFMMWTKMRAMQKLQQVQVQASQQITQIQGEKQELQEQLKVSGTAGLEGLIGQRDEAYAARDEAQNLVTSLRTQMDQLQQRHNEELNTLRGWLEQYKPKEVTVVK